MPQRYPNYPDYRKKTYQNTTQWKALNGALIYTYCGI